MAAAQFAGSRASRTFTVGLAALTLAACVLRVEYVAAREAPSDQAPSAAAASDAEILATIDRLIRERWQAERLRPAAEADAGEWGRRVYLDLIGRIPTVEETRAYVGDRSRDRKQQLVDRLLGEEHTLEYGRNWATIWMNLLVGRSAGQDRRSMVNPDGLGQYLRRSFYRNKPYDRMVHELIAARGSNTPGEENYNGAVNYLLAHLEDDGVQATARTAQVFLGMQVQCTQCHNHPFNDWKQDQFWGLNAFFRQAKPLRRYQGRDIASVRLEDQDYMGPTRNVAEAEVAYELRNGRMAVVYPTFIDGTTINPVGYVDEVNRRLELAELMLGSPFFTQAIVNRTWAHFLGYGFTRPVDDMGPHNPPSHPELLEYLAAQFAAHGYDLKQLMRWIVLSEAYGLSSKAAGKQDLDDPAAGQQPLFSRFYLRQMRAEELYESLLVATAADETTRGDDAEKERMKREWLRQFTIAFGTDENDESSTFNGTIPQALMLMNGELSRAATECRPGNLLHRVATGDQPLRDKVSHLYLAALSREPDRNELRLAEQLVRQRGDEITALADVWWALLNSNEFIFNH